jgi:DNA-binding CsgD family transcriptional regulator
MTALGANGTNPIDLPGSRGAPALLDASWKSIFDDLSEGVLVVDQAGHRVYSNAALNAFVATNACFPHGTVEPPPYVPADQRQRYLQAVQGSSSLLVLDGSGTTSTSLDLVAAGKPRLRTRVTIGAFSGSRGRFAVWLFQPERAAATWPVWMASPNDGTSSGLRQSLDGYLVNRTGMTVGSLTRREKDVLQLLLEGHRVASIARRLHVSPQTVRNHLKGVFHKLGAHSQVELLDALRPALYLGPPGPDGAFGPAPQGSS